jgi:hypothetical protein
MVRPFLLASAVVTVGALTTFAGCSSSSNKSTGGTDAGPTHDASNDVVTVQDTGTGNQDSSSGDDSSTEDAGGVCPSSETAPAAPTFATPPASQLKDCSTAEIQAFIAACVSSTSGCQDWFTANSGLFSADGGGGTTCGNCLFNETNPDLGGVYWSPTAAGSLGFEPNYAACIAQFDTSKGTACATALDANNFCTEWYCGDCGTGTSTTCESTVNNGTQCSSTLTTLNSACATDFADGGILDTTCSPSTVNGDTTGADDFAFIANLYCGSGSTTFSPDSGI